MPRTVSKPGGGEPTLARPKPRIGPDDIDEDWLDEMVKRLFAELKRQLSQVESGRPGLASPGERAADARTLASLERTLERLAKLEGQRRDRREKKVADHDGERTALERKIDRLAAEPAAPKGPGRPQR